MEGGEIQTYPQVQIWQMHFSWAVGGSINDPTPFIFLFFFSRSRLSVRRDYNNLRMFRSRADLELSWIDFLSSKATRICQTVCSRLFTFLLGRHRIRVGSRIFFFFFRRPELFDPNNTTELTLQLLPRFISLAIDRRRPESR